MRALRRIEPSDQPGIRPLRFTDWLDYLLISAPLFSVLSMLCFGTTALALVFGSIPFIRVLTVGQGSDTQIPSIPMTIQDLATFSTTTSMAVLLLTIPFGFVFLLYVWQWSRVYRILAFFMRLFHRLMHYVPPEYFQIRRDCLAMCTLGFIGVGSFIIAGMILSVRRSLCCYSGL